MYNDWPLINVNQIFEENRWSVVHKLPSINGQGVVNEVVKPLAMSLNNNNQILTNYSYNIGSNHNLNASIVTSNSNTPSLTFSGLHSDQLEENDLSKEEYINQNLNNGINSNNEINDYTYYLKTDRDVQWVMEVLCYGLSLSINTNENYETVRDCVQIYCEWMCALSISKAKTKLIPQPIKDNPNLYFKRILHHLYNIFVPRIGSLLTLHTISNNTELNLTDIISKQALLCHRVLRTISSITEDESNLMNEDTWDDLLLFLMGINDILLAQPGEREDIGTHLCERVITVLFEIWIIACKRCFPSPSYWKTLHHLFATWRHRPQVIEQWSNVCLVFTQRLVQLNTETILAKLQQELGTYELENLNLNSNYVQPVSQFYTAYINKTILNMDYGVISQAWYRFLLTINNPVDLSSPEIISRTKKFVNFVSDSVVDPRQHPCLDFLPQNFYKAMKGVCQLIDTFLGLKPSLESSNIKKLNSVDGNTLTSTSNYNSTEKAALVTPPNSRKLNPMKSIGKHTILGLHSVNKNSSNLSSLNSQSSSNQQFVSNTPILFTYNYNKSHQKYSIYRPKVNSILNIFGVWLFNAALNNNKSNDLKNVTNDFGSNLEKSNSLGSFLSVNSSNQTNNQNSINTEINWNLKNSTDRVSIEVPLALSPENFEAGVAEAIGALCRLFSSKQTDEEISNLYYAKFYLALQLGLPRKEPIRGQVLSSILLNGTQLFKINLSGINILIPNFLKAIELVIFEKENPKSKYLITSPIVELRRACIQIMLTLLNYPLHFKELPIKDCLTSETTENTFYSLMPYLVNLMLNTLLSENDSTNLQMILSGLLILLEDTAIFELEKDVSDKQAYMIKKNVSIEKKKEIHTSSIEEVLSIKKDMILDNAKNLYTVVLNAICHLLITQKKNDTQVSLAALEVLSAIARIHLNSNNIEESKKATKCICDYIVSQCSRPPPHHSKDMHSTLVAAYQCLSIWFAEHSYLLKDDACLNLLLEVIELGISGSKSISTDQINNLTSSNNNLKNSIQNEVKKNIVFKTFKELKPASMRVRESSEFVLSFLMNQFGCIPLAPCPPECVNGCCDFNELTLLKYVNDNLEKKENNSNYNNNLSIEDACKKFKYFVSESSILIGFLNNPKDQNCFCLIRSPFGKFCWKMQFQLNSDNSDTNSDYSDVFIPFECCSFTPRNLPIPKSFPDSVYKIPLTKMDCVVPNLKEIIKEFTPLMQKNQEKIYKIYAQQKINEQKIKQKCLSDLKSKQFSCKKPKPCVYSDFDCARLIINHFGLMNLEKSNYNFINTAQLVSLDLNNSELVNQIINLDNLPLRTCDTAFVFYVRKGRIHPQEILNSVCSVSYVKPSFLDFLYSLGTPVHCKQHFGWTGNIFTSWKSNFYENCNNDSHYYAEHGGSFFDGQKMSIYWADILHEIAFIVPSKGLHEDQSKNKLSNLNNASNVSQSAITNLSSSMSTYIDEVKSCQKSISTEQKSLSSFSDETLSSTSHNLSENSSILKNSINSSNLTNNELKKKNKQNLNANIGCDIKILIIWLENSEDEYNLPIDALLVTTDTGVELSETKDYIAILIHPLKNGLFTIKIITSQERIPMALPLINGIVVNKRILGGFVRLTTLNFYKRRRLDMDCFQFPHVKRRVKIQELCKKYRLQGKELEFFNSLF